MLSHRGTIARTKPEAPRKVGQRRFTRRERVPQPARPTGVHMTPEGVSRSVVGLVLLVGLSACSSGGADDGGSLRGAAARRLQEQCLDSGTGEGPMDNK